MNVGYKLHNTIANKAEKSFERQVNFQFENYYFLVLSYCALSVNKQLSRIFQTLRKSFDGFDEFTVFITVSIDQCSMKYTLRNFAQMSQAAEFIKLID